MNIFLKNTIRILNFFNFSIIKVFPRHSVRFAKKYFKNKPLTIVEIGTFEGKNAKNILESLNIKEIFLIDPYEIYKDYLNSEPRANNSFLSKAEKIAKKRLGKYKNKIIWLKKFSDDAIKEIPNLVDFIYIDGNHEYKYVKKDLENYWGKIKKGGILAGHDVGWKGVSDALIEFSYKNKLSPFLTREDWWIIKE